MKIYTHIYTPTSAQNANAMQIHYSLPPDYHDYKQ